MVVKISTKEQTVKISKTITPKEMETRNIRIVEDDGTKTIGQIKILSGKGFDRVAEFINNKDDLFLPVYNATIYENGIANKYKQPCVLINKHLIRKAIPDESPI